MRKQLRRRLLSGAPPREVFTAIYNDNIWGNSESRSGWGSTLEGPNGTAFIRKMLINLVSEFSVTSIVDVPCGDFNWFRAIDLAGISYLGADIVPAIIARNNAIYGTLNIRFTEADLITWTPPPSSLIVVRDLLIHLRNEHAIRCLRNVIRSRSRLLLISNYADIRRNGDTFTGGLRMYNLRRPPFAEFDFGAAVVRQFADGDGSRGRQMLLCDIEKLAGAASRELVVRLHWSRTWLLASIFRAPSRVGGGTVT
jgi:hypothetical protein